MTTTVGAIPWYRSPVYIGAVVTILSTLASLEPKAAALLGLTSTDAISSTVNSIFSVIALLAGVFTAYQRQTSTIQPLTLTKAGADAHPATELVKLAAGQPGDPSHLFTDTTK